MTAQTDQDEVRVSEPRALSLDNFGFNFTIGLDARARGAMGAPAFAIRRKRLDQAVTKFWDNLAERYDALWIGAGEGRIDEEGREIRQVLLDEEGHDPIGAVDHAKRLFRDRLDPAQQQRKAFARAWTRHLRFCGLEALQAQVESYNRFFPVEANLATDPEKGCFLWMGKTWVEEEAPTQALVLERHPLR